MRNKAGMKFDCILEEPLDFIDIDYTHLNKTVRYEERPHGEWIKKGNNCFCSNCKFELESYILGIFYNFCPRCGADMRKEGDGE